MKKILVIFVMMIVSLQLNSQNKNSNLNDALKLNITGNGYQDNLWITFNQNATANFDPEYDLVKIFGIYAAPQFFSCITPNIYSPYLSINSVPHPIGTFTVQLGLIVGKDTSYTINATGANSFTNYPYVLLEDTKLNVFVNLSQQTNYTFNALTSDSVKRFKVYFYNTNYLSIKRSEINQVKIYPNPATKVINIESICKNATIEIYDIQGKQLLQQHITETQIDISSFAKGIYIVKIQTEKETLQSKFVKE